MRLNTISDNQGATKNRIRVGRGIGSGKGKTGGRGQKGQTSRSGVAINGFEGGQMPLHMRMPKRGFNSWRPGKYNAVRLDRVQRAIDSGKLDAKKVIDGAALVEAGVIRRVKDGVRLIAGGEFKASKATFNVAHASAGALKAIEEQGGKVDMPKAEEKTGKKADAKAARKAKADARLGD